jgi:hypothetical protein
VGLWLVGGKQGVECRITRKSRLGAPRFQTYSEVLYVLIMRLKGSLALLDCMSPFGRRVSYVLELAHAEALIISRKCNDQVHTKANDDGHWQKSETNHYGGAVLETLRTRTSVYGNLYTSGLSAERATISALSAFRGRANASLPFGCVIFSASLALIGSKLAWMQSPMS